MTGTGVQDDPYIPETWDEFVSAIGTKDAYVSLPEGGGTFDLNDIAPKGGFTLYIYCKQINGNGWSIKNSFNVRFFVSSSQTDIYSLNFLNFYIDIEANLFSGNNNTFDNCKFAGIIATSHFPFYKVYLSRCSVHYLMIGTANGLFSSSSKCTVCNIIIDHSKTTKTSIDIKLYGDYNFYEHYIKEDVATTVTIDGKASVWHKSGDGGLVSDTQGNTYTVTEEQLRDASYLLSMGFPVVGD